MGTLSEAIKQNISIVDYAARAGFTPVKVSSNRMILKEHDSCVIKPHENLFCWNSQNIKGSVIDFAMAIKGITKEEAYDELKAMLNDCNYKPSYVISKDRKIEKPIQPNKLTFPKPSETGYNRMYAYLTKTRAIEPKIVKDLVSSKNLYEDEHHNCCFVGYDYDGEAKYGFKRGTATVGKLYRGELFGTNELNKQIGWYINNHANKLFVCEACIDCMSIMSFLDKNGADYKAYNYLPLGGTYVDALKHHITRPENSNIKTIYLATDNDEAGNKCRAEIRKMLKEVGYKGLVKDKVPISKDWNEDLQAAKQAKQPQQQAQQKQNVTNNVKKRVMTNEYHR